MSRAVPRVLVVDDDARIRDFVRRVFDSEGLEVESAASGEAALQLFTGTDFDVAVIDLGLPGIGGLDLLANFHELDPEVANLVLTGSATVESAVQAMKRGAFDYLTKPIQPRALVRAVRKALEHSSVVRENVRLKRVVDHHKAGGPQVASSPSMQQTLELARRVAQSSSPVLIGGETGAGKSFIARKIHEASPRAERVLIQINCGSLPEQLVEGELFGHEAGAYTGAVNQRPGLFESADGGTLFLDEIAELPPLSQTKLLQVLDSGEIRRLGSNKVRQVDTRILAATNKILEEEVASGRFREDLFFRLKVLEVHVPPLRERPEDLEELIGHYLHQFTLPGAEPRELDETALARLRGYSWPGNVRELRNIIERASLLSPPGKILPESLALVDFDTRAETPVEPLPLREAEKMHVEKVLRRTQGNRAEAARLLAIDPKTLRKKIQDFGLG